MCICTERVSDEGVRVFVCVFEREAERQRRERERVRLWFVRKD